MRCHYEVLGVERSASDDEIKRSYRKLALVWHPDKNRENESEATAQFRLIQQAYDVLSEPQERAWYDKHRERIIRAGLDRNYDDKCVDVFPFFSASCYKGFSDDEGSFYSVYRELFKTIAAEDLEFMNEDGDDGDEVQIPEFGTSDSHFTQVVGPFYAYWQSYCTCRPYSWLDQHDVRMAPNRWVLRQMEKENRKTRSAAKKERNEQVRALVMFVKRRDKRVSSRRQQLQQLAAANSERQQLLREQQRLQRLQLVDEYREEAWTCSEQHEQQLQEMEASVAREFGDVDECCGGGAVGDTGSDNDSESDSIDLSLYCAACDKLFHSEKTLQSHQGSKKHRENTALLKAAMLAEEKQLNGSVSDDTTQKNGIDSDSSHDDDSLERRRSRRNERNRRRWAKLSSTVTTSIDYDDDDSSRDQLQERLSPVEKRQEEESDTKTRGKTRRRKAKNKTVKPPNGDVENQACSSSSSHPTADQPSELPSLHCRVCRSEFTSKNKLFQHIKSTGHALVEETSARGVKSTGGGKRRSKR